MSEGYQPETYWSEVASRIADREDGKNVIAGDDEPYYRYKRERFLSLLKEVDFSGKKVLEIGSGPGGNLVEVLKMGPQKLMGADVSAPMIELAKKKLPPEVELVKVNGTELPFPDQTFDIVFTATVLQHNTDEAMLKALIKEICRVSAGEVYLFERIEKEILGDELCYGRPVSYYAEIMKNHGFELVSTKFINIRSSYYVSGAIRKGLNPKERREGEPLTGIAVLLQKLTLPLTKITDRVFTSKKDVARLAFRRV
jgi:ubiquinone/menaquinone biosynthesis C-methylase UbiE